MFKAERAHPIMIFTAFFKQLRGFLLPMIFAVSFQFRRGDGLFENRYSLYFVLGFLALSLIGGFLRWFFFTYDYQEGVLHIRSGIFVKKERYIQKERVQTVNYKANVFYRLLDLVTLQIETAGGFKEPEIDIEAIHRSKAGRLRDGLKQQNNTAEGGEGTFQRPETAPEAPETQNPEKTTETRNPEKTQAYTVGYRRLALAGITSGGVGVILSFIAVIFGQTMAFVPEDWINRFFAVFQRTGVTVILSLVFFAFLLAWLISLLRFIIAYGEFRIEKGQGEILIRRGLLEQKELSIKTHRIQGIRITEGLLRQPFGYASVQVEVAGGASQQDGFKTMIHPLIHRGELPAFLALTVPERVYHQQVKPLPPRALRRYLIRSFLPLLPFPVAFYFIPGNLIWIGMIIFPLSALFGYFRYKDGGYRIDDKQLTLRYRLFARTTVLLKRKQIQSLKMQTNFLQKLRRLTSVNATILSAMMRAEFTLKDLELEDALEIWQWYQTGKSTKPPKTVIKEEMQ
ncbi:PH domain-containing protein [Isachenkonia alkalipeptolytica]|nr:PH domain-containing protein [Isachenkonia alkalipeptolytica]